jgi:hypothetical protein
MKNVKIERSLTFNEDSQIAVWGTVEVDNQVVKFQLETNYNGNIVTESDVKLNTETLVKLLIEEDDYLECFLFLVLKKLLKDLAD